MRLRKLEAKAGNIKVGKATGGFDPVLNMMNPNYTGEEMANV